ncbi:hypothetical protein PVAP13_2KG479015 [Panicum virgatum]|uniref:Uncharacterized protein n=1 Tax=Panicum virgatum TaxID=38727 RepID=A0A8T0WF67_PANVG|nr:hypothetical protein PVAP13_2KG479015 [Panicum virgatum]
MWGATLELTGLGAGKGTASPPSTSPPNSPPSGLLAPPILVVVLADGPAAPAAVEVGKDCWPWVKRMENHRLHSHLL